MSIDLTDFLLIQLYWFSFSFIGLVITIYLKNYSRTKKLIEIILNSSISLVFVVTTGIGFAMTLFYIIPGYIFALPILGLKITYILLLTVSILLAYIKRRELATFLKSKLTKREVSPSLIFFIVVVVIVYVMSSLVGGLIDGDAKVFISMINQWVTNGVLDLNDPYFGWNGVSNIGYSTNIHFALRALISDISGVNAINVWRYSNAYYVLLLIASFVIVGWTFLGSKKFSSWIYAIASIAAITQLNSYFMPAIHSSLPSVNSKVWTILLIVGIKLYLDKGVSSVLFLSVGLLAVTHSFSAAMAAIFMTLLVLIMVIFKRANLGMVVRFAFAAVILSIPIFVSLMTPRYIKDDQFINNRSLSAFGGVAEYFTPLFNHISIYGIVFCVIICSLFFVHKVVKSRLQLLLLYLLMLVVLVLLYNSIFLSLLGFVYLMYIVKSPEDRILLVTLFLFSIVTIHNPVFIAAIASSLPAWAIVRLAEFNVWQPVTVSVGLLFAVQQSLSRLRVKKSFEASAFIVIALSVVIIPLISGIRIKAPWDIKHDLDTQSQQSKKIDVIRQMGAEIDHKIVYSNDPEILTSIPNVYVANFVSLPFEGPSPFANRFKRDKCHEYLESNLTEDDLVQAGVKTIISSVEKGDNFDLLARSKDYLEYKMRIGDYKIYTVTSTKLSLQDVNHRCFFPTGQ